MSVREGQQEADEPVGNAASDRSAEASGQKPVQHVSPPASGPRWKLPLALGATFAAFYLPLGIQMPFLPLWLQYRGLGPEEIGIAIAVPLVARLFATPVLGFVSDKVGRPRAVLALLGVATVFSTTALAFSVSPLLIFIALGLTALSWNPSFSLLDSYTARQARAGRVDYGRARQWGSGSFLIANLVGGVIITALGAGAVVFMMLAGHLAYLAFVNTLPELERPAPPPPRGAGGIREHGWLVLGVLGVALVQASHAQLYAFGSMQWQAEGYSLTIIGLLWAVGVAAEIALFRFGTRLVVRFGALGLIVLGGVAAVVRFAAMAFDPPLAVLVPLQLLHAFTFGATYLGMVELVARGVPEHRSASAQSLASWTVSLMMAGGSIIAGLLWVMMGAHAFLISAAIGGAGAAVALLARMLRPPNTTGRRASGRREGG